MCNRAEIRLTGSGGQGIILASIILAEAATLSGKMAAQSQSYGPEARGGICRSEVIVSENPIGFTKVQNPTFLMALTQKSADLYTKQLDDDCTILIDSTLIVPEVLKRRQVICLPILKTASEKVGKPMVANIVSVGIINELLHLSNDEQLQTAVLHYIPEGTERINLYALAAGKALGKSAGQFL